MRKPIYDPLSKHLDRNSRIEVKNTTCYMCACRCGIRVTRRDGEICYIQGNLDHPLNKGVICAKGYSCIMKQYSPVRLTKPLLRKAGSDRGDNQFEEVSWDKAFDMACPTNARLFGDVNDPDSEAAIAIRERGGYQLMPEWGTRPANHYLPRRKTRITIHEDELIRVDNPLKKERQLPMPDSDELTLDDVTSW